jgi:hypothetical protein
MKNSLIGMQDFLNAVRIPIRLACKTKTDWPIVISLWFVHQDGLLYCATQSSAKIVSYLQHDNRCAFEIAADQPPYCGIRGQAKVWIDEKLGVEVLEKLLVRYLGGTDNALAKKLLANSESEVAIVLEPVRIYSWDFSDRMQAIEIDFTTKKDCP